MASVAPLLVRLRLFRFPVNRQTAPNTIPVEDKECSPSHLNAVRNHNGMVFAFRPEPRQARYFPWARVLERVPHETLRWKPHPSSYTVGQLAMHVATIPGEPAAIAGRNQLDTSQIGGPPEAKNAAELIPTLEASLDRAKQVRVDSTTRR